jgi:glycosyltransferase involved in cell wall biosynthesis
MISVIVPAFNAADTLDLCLDALAQQTISASAYEVLVVDDGSSDATPTRAGAHPGVRVLTQAHAGPAAARNLGAQEARAEIVLFTDADCAPAPDWIEQMTAAFSAESDGAPSIAAVKGTYRTLQKEMVARFVQEEYEEKYRRMARRETIDFVDTYSAGYRRDVFLENEGFDSRFPVDSVEDQEFSFRLARRGYRMVFAPRAQVTHWGHAKSLAAYCRRKYKIGYWKVVVVRRYPGTLWSDSHTPPSLRMQVTLSGLLVVCLLGAMLWPLLAWGGVAVVLLFLSTTLPFCREAWRKDRAVALAAPFLLLARALALGTGFLVGLVSSLPRDQLQAADPGSAGRPGRDQ